MRLTWPCNRSAGGAALELSFHTLQSWEGTSFSDGKAADELVLSRSQLAAKVRQECPACPVLAVSACLKCPVALPCSLRESRRGRDCHQNRAVRMLALSALPPFAMS